MPTKGKTAPQHSIDPIPRGLPPIMQCASVDVAFDKSGWIFEPKLDGLRVICTFDGQTWTLLSRNAKPQNFMFPEIVAGLEKSINRPAVLDGEIVVLDEAGRSSFRALQQRFHLTEQRIVAARMATHPAQLFLFDILYFDKFDTRKLPLADRKHILKNAVRWKPPVRWTEITLNKGKKLFDQACKEGLEGIIAKRAASAYTGDRRGAWLKIKCSGRQEFVIGGFTPGRGARVGFGSLLIGYHDDAGKLRFAGKVGTGFDTRTLVDLRERMEAIEISKNPFLNGAGREVGARYVEPILVAEVAFAEWTQNDLLRQPRFQGLRQDKNAASVKRETPAHLSGEVAKNPSPSVAYDE